MYRTKRAARCLCLCVSSMPRYETKRRALPYFQHSGKIGKNEGWAIVVAV